MSSAASLPHAVQRGVVEIGVSGFALNLIQVGGEVFRDKPIKEQSKNVSLEIPPVNATPQIVGYPPDRSVQLGTLRFLGLVHGRPFSILCLLYRLFIRRLKRYRHLWRI